MVWEVRTNMGYNFIFQYPQRPSHDENGAYNMHLPRSFIRSVPASSAHPSSASSIKSSTRARSSDHRHSQSGHPTNAGGERKSDPVSKYTAYNEAWKEKKAPGEQNRNQLRWKIRVSIVTCMNKLLDNKR